MKRIISLLLIAVILLGSISYTKSVKALQSTEFEALPKYSKVKLVMLEYYDFKPFYYKIYRANVSKKYLKKHSSISHKKYKYIGKTKKIKYTDKSVKSGKTYAYAVKAYNKKNKLIGNYYKDQMSEVVKPGFAGVPKLINSEKYDEYGTYYNMANKTCMVVDSDSTKPVPNSIAIYRKAAGQKKFKKIKTIKTKKIRNFNESFNVVKDSKVKPTKTYYYKVKAITKVGKKRYYSKFSKTVKIKAINYYGQYDIDCLTPKSEDCEEFVFSIKNKVGNGSTTIYPTSSEESFYEYQESKTSTPEYYSYIFDFKEYSYDNKTWKTIDMDGVSLPKSKPLYIKVGLGVNKSNYATNHGLDIDVIRNQHIPIPFGGKETFTSQLRLYGEFEYSSSTVSDEKAEGLLNFVSGKGSVHHIGAE